MTRPNLDLREFSIALLERLWTLWEDEKVPTIILFFGSVYSAPIAIEGKDPFEQNLIDAVESSVEKM